jgi:hypothetical protein
MILPIHLLDTGDEMEFGKEYVLLSKLHRLGFPIATGFVVAPPRVQIREFIVDHDVKDLVSFETKQASLKGKLLNFPIEDHTLSASERRYLKEHWPDMVSRWLVQLQSHFTRFGQLELSHLMLKAAPLFITSDILAQGIAFWEDLQKKVVIQTISGSIDHSYEAFIDDLVRKMNRKLGISYTYQFVVTTDGIKIIHLQPLMHQLPEKVASRAVSASLKSKHQRRIKLFTTFSGDLTLDEYCDGYLLESQRFSSHDQKQLVLLETMIAKHPQIILYQIAERFIKSDAAAIKLCRNQKNHDNIELVFPSENKDQLMQLKRDLAAEGISRKGKLKYWLRVSLPAMVLQMMDLVEEDFDGVIFDVDFLAAALHGRDITEQGLESDIDGLIRFLDPYLKQLGKKQIPFMFYGELVGNEELIKKSIKWQIQGLVIESNSQQMDEKLATQEQLIGFSFIQS